MSDIPAMEFAAETAADDIPPMEFGGAAPVKAGEQPSERQAQVTEGVRRALKGFSPIPGISMAESASLGDLLLSIPGQLLGIGGDIGVRARAIGRGDTRTEQASTGAFVSGKVNEALGQPLAKLMLLAGLGPKEGDENTVDSVMHKAASLISKGGEWVEKNTNGLLVKGDVESIVNAAMGAAGGRGLAAGLREIAPESAAIYGGVRMSPQALRRFQEERMQAMDPKDVGPEVTAQAAEAAQAAAAQTSRYSSMAPAERAEINARAYTEMAREAETSGDTTGAAKYRSWAAAARAGEPTTGGKVRIADGRELKLDPIRGTFEEAIPEMGAPLPKASTLDSALEKVSGGRSFDMTAEERIAYKGWRDEPPPAAIVDEQGNALTSGPIRNRGPYSRQRGAVDMGAFIPRKEGEPGLSLEQFEALSPALSLGSLIQRSDYTLKTLDRLPQNRTEFTKAHIEQELKRADVTDAERGAVTSALEQAPGDKISAKDLMVGVKKATGDFELEAKKTDQYANYGLDAIRDPGFAPEEGGVPVHVAEGELPPSTTTLYRLPSHLTLSDANHFNDPNLFGWTRSFTEDGVRHVVEIQSDLAQKAGKTLSAVDRNILQEDLDNVREQTKIFDQNLPGKGYGGYEFNFPPNEFPVRLRDAISEASRLNEDVKMKMGSSIQNHGLFKADGRGGILDPELSFDAAMDELKAPQPPRQRVVDAVRGAVTAYRKHLSVLEAEHSAKLKDAGQVEAVAPLLKNWPKRLVREELAQAADAGEPAVRFATADTVAKVEGWPDRQGRRAADLQNMRHQAREYETYVTDMRYDEAHRTRYAAQAEDVRQEIARMEMETTKFRPEHQSIYDRYRRDIEKFAQQLGGKPVTDAQGHTWIEVPTPRRGPKQMFGAADPKLLARMAAIGLGAWAGQYFDSDHDLLDAVMGAGAGAVLSHITPTKAVAGLRALAKPDSRIKINDMADAHEKITKLAAIDVWGLQKQVETLVPKAKDRVAITHAIEANDIKSLPPKSQAAAKIVVDYYDSKLWEGISADVLKSAKDNYVTHLWDWSKNNPGLIAQWLDRSGTSGGMSPSSPYAKARSVPTIAEGKLAGLTPLTEDVSQIMGIYGNSMSRSIANKHFMEALKSERDPTGRPLVIAAADAPHSYKAVNTPQLAGMRVHPDIEPSLKMLFDTSSPGAAMKIMAGISDTAKRVAVTASLFHAKALTDALIGGSSNPFKAVGQIPGFVLGTSKYLQELKKGSASPLVERAAEGGLTYSLERAGAGVEDAGVGFYGAMKWAEGLLDKTIPGTGILAKGAAEMNHKFDTFMWARLHAGMKLMTFAEKYQQILDNSTKRAMSVTPDRAARIAASFTNDLFGGLNWRRVAEDATTRWGRSLGQAVLHPGARRAMQILMFAPDWTISTTRAAVKAFGPGTGFRGLVSPVELADFHRQYLLRSAMYYLIVGDAINYSMSGHHLWENKDPTMVDMDPQGNRHMQWSKHTMEPVHWVTKPAQQAVNKLGFLPRETANQVLGTEYLSTSGKSPPMENRLRHLAKNFAPIALQQSSASQGDLDTILAGMAGVPIYGSTPEQKAERKRLRKLKKEAAK